MTFNGHGSESSTAPETSIIYTANTPSDTGSNDNLDDHDFVDAGVSQSIPVPWPGSTFIIRSISSGHVITLLNGKVILAAPGGRGSIHWKCEESEGWLGFRNTTSGKLLGHDVNGNLHCSANKLDGWEFFQTRMNPDGGCILLLTHRWHAFDTRVKLWHVGSKKEGGTEKLAKVAEGGTGGITWDFIKIIVC
ncbi:uncharacterized protein KY384_004595 [Bacidia gigantensis]|uniref:uncharacterized protein n=1 Tax=Bacidia gigantensis TaxID=2732470 RepID=UPI001D056ABC|nr:uncharacterized protein KY384_004595 [Bacidia gigantensis]KAG8531237.1 hypothetical protein KY384_004595 [Bacidia gigantensis]